MKFMDARAFRENAHEALADKDLREALARMNSGFIPRRQQAVDQLPEFDALRDRGVELRNHVLAQLDH
jgi:L-lactate dehydrogenase complex protein LldF